VRRGRLLAAAALAVLALGSAALAHDLRGWETAVRRGDAVLASDPAAARWHAAAILPADPAYRLLGIGGDLAYRDAVQQFLPVERAPASFDNGVTSTRRRGTVEAVLTSVARSDSALRSSRASNMLGILAFSDAIPSGPAQPAPVESSVADFRAAIRADPTNADAKFNLELVLRLLQVHGRGQNANTTEGVQRGQKGASGAVAGRGY
jgi:hypothetical protein